jgi:hypothetical protein
MAVWSASRFWRTAARPGRLSLFIAVSPIRLETGPARQPQILNAVFDDLLGAIRERRAAGPLPVLRLDAGQPGPFLVLELQLRLSSCAKSRHELPKKIERVLAHFVYQFPWLFAQAVFFLL